MGCCLSPRKPAAQVSTRARQTLSGFSEKVRNPGNSSRSYRRLTRVPEVSGPNDLRIRRSVDAVVDQAADSAIAGEAQRSDRFDDFCGQDRSGCLIRHLDDACSDQHRGTGSRRAQQAVHDGRRLTVGASRDGDAKGSGLSARCPRLFRPEPTKPPRPRPTGRPTGPSDLKANTPPTWARASRINTPGMTGRPGKCP